MTDATERWAAAALMCGSPQEPRLLLLRRSGRVLDLPTVRLAPSETIEQGARRSLQEQAGVASPPEPGPLLSAVSYRFDGAPPRRKEVSFVLVPATEPLPAELVPTGDLEARWIRPVDADHVPLQDEQLRFVLRRAFDSYAHALTRAAT